MKDYLISMYIDNELDLKEKIDFVETVHADRRFKSETVDLLQQETILRQNAVSRSPEIRLKTQTRFFRHRRPVFALAAAGLAAMVIAFLYQGPESAQSMMPYRFVFFQPDTGSAQIVGSFTGWNPIAMKRAGDRGYWEIVLELPPGEHRYGYLIEGGHHLADPTISAREADDFGGENSVLHVKAAA